MPLDSGSYRLWSSCWWWGGWCHRPASQCDTWLQAISKERARERKRKERKKGRKGMTDRPECTRKGETSTAVGCLIDQSDQPAQRQKSSLNLRFCLYLWSRGHHHSVLRSVLVLGDALGADLCDVEVDKYPSIHFTLNQPYGIGQRDQRLSQSTYLMGKVIIVTLCCAEVVSLLEWGQSL